MLRSGLRVGLEMAAAELESVLALPISHSSSETLRRGNPPQNLINRGALQFIDSKNRRNLLYLASTAGVAQLVEQLICNQPVASSSLVTSLFSKSPS